MLTRVEIMNYRGFKSYRMEGLARVNLLVGKNNSGKTALLEGIQFLTSGGDVVVLAEVAERRGELVPRGADANFRRPERPVSVDVAHFFHGHTLDPETSFSISGDNGYKPVTVSTVAKKNGRAESGQRRPSGKNATGYFLEILVGTRSKSDREESGFRLSEEGAVDFQISPRFPRPEISRRSSGPQVRFVGPDSLNFVDLAMMWDEVTLTGQEMDVAGAMRILDRDLASIHFLTGMLASGYYPSRGGVVVGVKGQDRRVPLGSMGDGMRRLMSLATSLAFTRDGCLFIDEIETGLHYSVMPDMWKLVISKAASSNIQVFATTHSWDCIEGLGLLCQREPELMSSVAIHKIDRAVPHSVPFTGEAIVRMVKSDIDPR